ncbi:MAG: electron transfer flavoprotein subunit alpha/FixB family protein [Bryobacterales bacterium]|nr:electron transfer flavoprotein subunit alpha/FixB family protein [Bryobacterales bacterium]
MNGILVVTETGLNGLHKMSLETVAAGQQLSRELGQPVSAAVFLTAPLSAKLDRVYRVQHDLLSAYTADGYTAALEALIHQADPAVVLFPHTYQVRDFAPKLATRFGQVLISDIIGVHEGKWRRQLFQGKLNADFLPQPGTRVFASIQAGAFRADQLEAGAAPEEIFSPALDPSLLRQKPEPPFRESARAVDLSAADVIVSVGRGIKEQDNIPVVEELAKALGAELAASRPICDNGWLPMERQVGSSGQTVAPKVYVAVGISGAIQHLVGMKGSKTIVAINKDPNAPIFEVADYGIIGDLFEVVPALVDEVKKARG